MNANSVRKIVWGKTTAMAIHPSCDKTIVCAGDTCGNIGFWNVVSKNNLSPTIKIFYCFANSSMIMANDFRGQVSTY